MIIDRLTINVPPKVASTPQCVDEEKEGGLRSPSSSCSEVPQADAPSSPKTGENTRQVTVSANGEYRPPYSPSHSSFVVYPRKGTLRKPKPPPGVPFDPYSLVAEDTDSGDPLHTQNKTLYLQDMLAGEARRARGEPAFPSIHGEGSVKMREAEPASEPVVCEPPERPLLQDPFDDTNKVVDVAVEEEDEATATSKRENYSRPRRLATCPPCIEVS